MATLTEMMISRRMQDFSGGGGNFKILSILGIHAVKWHVASTEAASYC